MRSRETVTHWAHNPKTVGSTPTSATKQLTTKKTNKMKKAIFTLFVAATIFTSCTSSTTESAPGTVTIDSIPASTNTVVVSTETVVADTVK